MAWTAGRTRGLWVPGLFIALCGLLAIWFGPAADYDLRNYHLYDAYALLNGRLRQDLVPAQLQTFHAPSLDSLIELLRRPLDHRPRLFVFVLSLPYALCVWCVWRLQSRMLTRWTRWRYLLLAAATITGATGAAALPAIGTPMSDAPCLALLLSACLLCLDRPDRRRLCGAGLCLGVAVGLKLTAAGPAVGIATAWAITDAAPRRLLRLTVLLGAAALGAGAVGGWWWALLWSHTGNPLFPYYNDVFRSPLLPPVRFADRRFLPRSLMQAVFYPFWWAARPCALASELPVRDPRLAAAEAVVLWAGAAGVVAWRRGVPAPAWLDRRAAFLLIACAVTYALWAVQFGILRYLAVLEFLAGAVLLLPLRAVAPRRQPAVALAGAVLAVAALAMTIWPDWGRLGPRAAQVVDVRLPAALPPHALLILLDPAPMAYVALAVPDDAVLIGANNNLVRPGDDSGLARLVAVRIAAHAGPLYGLETPPDGGSADAATLRAHRLHRLAGCAPVHSSLDGDAISLCPLGRDP